MTDESLFHVSEEIVITVKLFGVDNRSVEVTATDDEGLSRTETITDEAKVIGVYTLMDLLLDVMEGNIDMNVVDTRG